MEEKLYKNREWMYEHYIEMQESTYAMAREADCGQATIRRWLRKLDIPTRTHAESVLLRDVREFQPYRNQEWLHEHYIVLQESTVLIAQKADCGQRTVLDWLHKFNIPVRTYGESSLLQYAREFQPYRNEDWLREHYIELEESTYTMAREAGCVANTILRWLHEFDIPPRTRDEGIFLAKRNYLDLSSELSNLLDGELLGDGCITMHSSRSAVYSHGSKYEEYVAWLSRIFADLGLEQSGKICSRQDKKRHNWSYGYASRSYPELVPIRQRWYPNGEKIVPKDLILTPIMARQWFIGDGGLNNRVNGRPNINFSTDAFDRASIDHLLEELSAGGFKVTYQPSRNRIGMSAHSVKDFLDYIGLCPIDCYDYKWDYQDNRKGHRINP